MAREFFTVDLRGLRAALAARAAQAGMSESDLLRSALVAALRDGKSLALPFLTTGDERLARPGHVKLSVRITCLAAQCLDQSTRAAGLSRGAYLAQLIEGAPPVVASTDLQAGFAALSASATELAALSRDISHLTHLLRIGEVQPALEYRGRLETLDADVRKHLDLAAATLAEISSSRAGVRRTDIFNPSRPGRRA